MTVNWPNNIEGNRRLANSLEDNESILYKNRIPNRFANNNRKGDCKSTKDKDKQVVTGRCWHLDSIFGFIITVPVRNQQRINKDEY